MRISTKEIVRSAIFAAFLCVFSILSVPVGAVPVSLGLFAVFLTAILLGQKPGFISVLIYILLGCVGLPVFSGFHGGIYALLGPTGGYIMAYLIIAPVMGKAVYGCEKNIKSFLRLMVAGVLSLLILYIFGTWWYVLVTKASLGAAVKICIVPFVFFDVVKLVFSVVIGIDLKNRIIKLI